MVNLKYLLIWILIVHGIPLMSQPATWINEPQADWPQIAMINEVWYENGERYVHPSFDYAATGFLIDAGRDTLAATVKHVLWIAKPKDLQTVDIMVGILSGFAVARSTGEQALYGVSTNYLQKVLSYEQGINQALIPLTDVLLPEIMTKGIRAGIKAFQTIKAARDHYFHYDLSLESLNAVGDGLLEAGRIREAITIYKLNLRELAWSPTYTKLGKAYIAKGKAPLAEKALRHALELWPDNKEAASVLKGLKE